MKCPPARPWFRFRTPLRAPFHASLRALSLAFLLATGQVGPVRASDMPPHAMAAGDHDDAGPRGERLRIMVRKLSRPLKWRPDRDERFQSVNAT